MLQDIFAVAVLYNLPVENSAALKSINESAVFTRSILNVLVYDNSLRSHKFKKEAFQNLDIQYHHDPDNSGVSAAYNFAADVAKSFLPMKNWLLLMDQDTRFPVEFLKNLRSEVTDNPSQKLFAPIVKLPGKDIAISPCFYFFRRGFPKSGVADGVHNFLFESVINSGMLIELKAFSKVGGYNQNIKLDFSDFEFINRFKKKYKSFFVCRSECIQDFANNEMSVDKLEVRYRYFCEGAMYSTRSNLFDPIMYFIVVFLRACTLSFRTKSSVFFTTFYRKYILR